MPNVPLTVRQRSRPRLSTTNMYVGKIALWAVPNFRACLTVFVIRGKKARKPCRRSWNSALASCRGSERATYHLSAPVRINDLRRFSHGSIFSGSNWQGTTLTPALPHATGVPSGPRHSPSRAFTPYYPESPRQIYQGARYDSNFGQNTASEIMNR
jgi:hypothetical protein